MSDIRITIPPDFASKTIERFGEHGRRWLHILPDLIADLAHGWSLSIEQPFELRYAYVTAVRLDDGSEAVLKVCIPNDEPLREMVTLRLYDGEGMCRLFASDPARYALLLERLRPGAMLSQLSPQDDEAATRIGANVMKRLFRPVPPGSNAKPIEEWFTDSFARHRAEYGGAGPFPQDLFERGEALANELLESAPHEVLLHGDLQHYNILSADREPWLAIDSKGMRGDPGYEAGPFLANPDLGGAERDVSLLRRRLNILAEGLEYDRARLRDWGVAHAVLSACWSAEEGRHGWEGAIATAEALLRV